MGSTFGTFFSDKLYKQLDAEHLAYMHVLRTPFGKTGDPSSLFIFFTNGRHVHSLSKELRAKDNRCTVRRQRPRLVTNVVRLLLSLQAIRFANAMASKAGWAEEAFALQVRGRGGVPHSRL